jgi:hypothetical protein
MTNPALADEGTPDRRSLTDGIAEHECNWSLNSRRRLRVTFQLYNYQLLLPALTFELPLYR